MPSYSTKLLMQNLFLLYKWGLGMFAKIGQKKLSNSRLSLYPMSLPCFTPVTTRRTRTRTPTKIYLEVGNLAYKLPMGFWLNLGVRGPKGPCHRKNKNNKIKNQNLQQGSILKMKLLPPIRALEIKRHNFFWSKIFF